jgi:hypothetical protein
MLFIGIRTLLYCLLEFTLNLDEAARLARRDAAIDNGAKDGERSHQDLRAAKA